MKPRGTHLVGSVPLESSEAVFRAVAETIGDRLVRVPDGETGERADWIGWQMPVLFDNAACEVMPPDPSDYRPSPHAKLRDGVDPATVDFRPLGYARAARDSFAVFTRLKREGVLSARMRFQVSLPTPLAPIHAFAWPASKAALEAPYERALLAELDLILESIPHDQLAIQWDCAIEMGMLEGRTPLFFDGGTDALYDRMARPADHVPPDVEVGYHLCYGDFSHRHYMTIPDASKCVEAANELTRRVTRRLDWIHFPVPRDRFDDAYIAPARDLRLRPETRIFVGLIHLTDGVEGTRRRVETASRVLDDFGVATECGFGRRPPTTIPELLREHAEVTAPV